MKKRFLSALLCICLVVAVVGFATTPTAQARWTNTRSIKLDMALKNDQMTSEGTISGYVGTTSISASFVLEKLVNGQYQYVDSWVAFSNTILLSSSRLTQNCTGGTYKLSISGTVVKDNHAEYVSDWLIKTF